MSQVRADVDNSVSDQTAATLAIGRRRRSCQILTMSIENFVVFVDGDEHIGVRGTIRLLTPGSSYRVRITRQEDCPGGVELTLRRVDENIEDLPLTQRWIVHASRCCAIGLILALTYCYAVRSGGTGEQPWQLEHLKNLWVADRPTASKESDEPEELPAIAVSLVEPVSVPASIRPTPESLLPSALALARSQRSRPVNAATVPWLCAAGDSGVCRMSGTAASDLQAFEAGLKTLTPSESADAVRSLRGALGRLSQGRLTAVPEILRVDSDDAEVYFHVVDGEPELLRVLPKSGPTPSALVSPPRQRL